jgi:hypothetical protein
MHLRRTLLLLGAALSLAGDALAEETPGARVASSIFSPALSPIPTTVDEMLPLHRRTNGTPQVLTSLPSTNSAPQFSFSFGAGNLEGEMRSDIDDNEGRMQRLYRKLDERGYLERREPKSDNRFTRAMDAIFAPEVIHIGSTAIAFSPYTAIKRKNPLCLLNPVPIAISW